MLQQKDQNRVNRPDAAVIRAFKGNRMMKKNDGYMTIEMAILFPVILAGILLVMFIGMVMYQEVRLQSLAVEASERGSIVYASRVSDMTTNVKTLDDFKIRDPYRNVPFLGSGKNEGYTSLVNTYVAERLNRSNMMSGTGTGGCVTTIEDYLLAKRVKVTLYDGYQTQGGGMEMFGQDEPLQVRTASVSAIVDSPDFVRNVDIVTDVARQTKAFDTVQDGYNKIKGAIEDVTELLQ